MVEVGQPAPDFTLQDHNSKDVSLSQYKGQKNVILSFHVFSFTGGWTHQVSSFRLANSAFEEKDTQVLGISTNARATQTAFTSSLGGIPYPVLSDFYPHGKVASLYGVFNEDRGTANRAVFLIDKDGIVRFKKLYPSAGDLNPYDILAEIDKLPKK